MSDKQTVWCHAGKLGDIMIMLPAWKAIYDETGFKPIVIVAEPFSNIFDGVSYVTPWPMEMVWWRDSDLAVRLAKQKFGHCYVPKFWDCRKAKPPLKRGEPTTTLRFHGEEIVISASDWRSYQLSQWEYAGFTYEQMMSWPLVFDRRSPQREEYMRRQWFRSSKPKLLYNLSLSGGNTSPFPHLPEVFPYLQRTGFELVNLAEIRAFRVYDLLGLYDRAEVLLTSDTATLHLANASGITTIAFVADGGSGSIPRGNCVLTIRYSEVGIKIKTLEETLKQIVEHARNRSQCHDDPHRPARPGNSEYHAVFAGSL